MSSQRRLATITAPLMRGLFLGALVCGLGAMPVGASELIYQPVNPNFGGNPLNGTFLLQQATDNNHFLTAPSSSTQPNSSQSFNSQVQSALLSALESQAAQIAVNEILGTNGQAVNQGTVNIGGELIQFQRTGGQINVNLTDTTTGANTQISVPVPQF
jgi:curli production assembly/transport component CsgF